MLLHRQFFFVISGIFNFIGFEWKEPGIGFRIVFFKIHTAEKTVEKTVEEILDQNKINPNVTLKELQTKTGLSRRGVNGILQNSRKKAKLNVLALIKGDIGK